MKKLLGLLLLSCISLGALAQTETPADTASTEEEEEVFPAQMLERRPEFPGGDAAFYKYLGQNIRYPKEARRNKTEGKVYVVFVIDKDGSVTDVSVHKGIGDGCDEEAMRVIKEMPHWSAGLQRNRPVRTRMMVPITFKL